MQPPPDEDRAADLDVLRRRLYAAGASGADLARYRDAVAASPVGAAPEPDAGPDARPAPPAPGRRAAVVLGCGALLAGLCAAALLRPAGAPTSRRTAGPPGPPQQVLPVAAGAAAGFRSALRRGRPAGLLRYLYAHPASLPSALSGITRAHSEEHASTGPGSMELEPSPAAQRGGRVTLVLVLEGGASAGWSLSRVSVRQNHEQYRQVVGDGVLRAPADAPAAVTLAYGAAVPTRLAIEVPPGVRWGAVVAFTD